MVLGASQARGTANPRGRVAGWVARYGADRQHPQPQDWAVADVTRPSLPRRVWREAIVPGVRRGAIGFVLLVAIGWAIGW